MVDVALLLEQPELGLKGLHVPRPEAEIRWVATSELEDPGPFLEGGELLLTTGLATKGWRSQWRTYAGRLEDAGVAALAVGVGLTHSRIPSALVRACEERALNLLEVPRETTFVAVSRAAARLIEKRDEAEARLALDTQRQLTAAAMGDDSRRALLQSLGQLLDGAAYLLSPDGRVVEPATGQRRSFADLDSARAELARLRPQGLRAASTLGDEHSTTLLVPVGLRGRPAFYLGVSVPGRMTDVRRSAVTTALALLGLATEQERDRVEARRRLWQKVHELLAHGDVDAAVLVGEAAGAPDLPSRVQVVRAAGDDDLVEDALGDLEDDHLLASRVGPELWLVGAPAAVGRCVVDLAARGLQVGVGEVVAIADVAASHDTAAKALARTTSTHRVVQWERVVREGAVGLLEPGVAAAFSASFLAGLDDRQVETLACFLRHHGSRLKVAEELGLHRNTVRNRLVAIESAIGRSLDDPDARASAWLALQALQGGLSSKDHGREQSPPRRRRPA